MPPSLPATALRRLLGRRFRRPAARRERFPVDTMRAMTPADWRALLAGPLERAVPRIEAAARDGSVEAMLALGQILLDGRAVVRDPAGAFAWFGAAAAAGHAMGINMLGRCHELGWGTERDPARAAALYARAAERGLDWAQFNLAMLMLRGHGVAKDVAAALASFARAAAQGHAKAMNMLGMLAEQGGASQQAVGWYRAAAEGGDFRGQFNLATVLVQDGAFDAAEHWFGRALASANPDVVDGIARLLAGHEDARLRGLAERAQAMARGDTQREQTA